MDPKWTVNEDGSIEVEGETSCGDYNTTAWFWCLSDDAFRLAREIVIKQTPDRPVLHHLLNQLEPDKEAGHWRAK